MISKYFFFSLKIVFVSANSEDPDEMPHYAALSGSSFFAIVLI